MILDIAFLLGFFLVPALLGPEIRSAMIRTSHDPHKATAVPQPFPAAILTLKHSK
jgi:hypothetical protein